MMATKILWASLATLVSASHRPQQTQLPSWQTIYPDTSLVVPLFGDEGPRWSLESTDGAFRDIPAKVPGDVLSDLMESNEIGDPYFSRNFLTQRHVWMGDPHDTNHTLNKPQQRTRTWKYTTQFRLETTTDLTWILVLESVKMGASIYWNGHHLGEVNDQFLRYKFVVDQNMLEAVDKTLPVLSFRHLAASTRLHELTILFDPSIGTDGRFMACSGGWDWAPYSRSVDDRGSPVFSFGISKPLYLVAVKSVFISHIVPKVYYKGPYPREPMRDRPHDDFGVSVDVHLEAVIRASSAGDDLVVVSRSTFSNETSFANVTAIVPGSRKVITVMSVASKEHIKLWWPNGLGNQPLYDLEISLQDSSFKLITPWVRKRIGFRVAALVTVNDTDDSVVADILRNNKEGSGSHGMYVRVNGAAIWSRGANFVPMDQLERRLTDRAHRIAVESAAAAHMNMLRVWGGGMILPDAFYDACDEKGILLYHDMMFVEEQGHGALRSQTVQDEIRHIVRSLASHASIIVWNGCNECTYVDKNMEIYSGYVMQTVAEEDDTRSIWPTSPSSHGWKTGVFMLDGRPNGNPLTTAPLGVRTDSQKPIEDHGPYQHGWSKSHPSVNGQFDGRKYETNTPSILKQSQIGVIFPNMFVSEFGSSVFSSFESMSDALQKHDWCVHGGSPPDSCHVVYGNRNECNGTNVLAERNYACDSHIIAYFGDTPLNEVGEYPFKFQLYQCMLAQALWIKGQLELFRSFNSFGALIWQMNEIWPTGGWGLIEYDGTSQGGRWKPLMHLLQSSLFRDVFVACGKDGICYIRNDGLDPVTAHIVVEGWNKDENSSAWVNQHITTLQSGPGSIGWFELPATRWNETDVVLVRACDAMGNELMEEIATFLDIPGSMTEVSLTGSASISVTSDNEYALVTVASNHLSLYASLSTRAKGRFIPSSFHLKPGIPKVVRFATFVEDAVVDMDLLNRTIRVDHLILTKKRT